MTILLTNDDGYDSPGIKLLAQALRDKGHRVFSVAPDKNRSGCSHSIEFLNGPVKLKKIGIDIWSCSGTPVDCIIVALLGGIPEIDIKTNSGDLNQKYLDMDINESLPVFDMDKAPDLILSGINAGANLGTDIIYSGTAAAARQGSFFGIPSIALSLVENNEKWYWDSAISYITGQLETFMGFWKPGSFVNINLPNIPKKPLALVPVFPSMRYYNDRVITYTPDAGTLVAGMQTAGFGSTFCFAKTGDTSWSADFKNNGRPKEGSDWAEVRKDNAALSVIFAQPQALQPAALG